MIAFVNAPQGYATLLAEMSEKMWKQKTEQFMKRTKSESLDIYRTILLPACIVETLNCFNCKLKSFYWNNTMEAH